MRNKESNTVYETPELSCEAVDMTSILCESQWSDGSIGDGSINDLGNL